jgi:hypothetical protein
MHYIKHRLQKFIFCLPLLIMGCTAPEIRLNQEAKRLNFNRVVVQGTEFEHVAYIHKPQNLNDELHVYLDGDGSPWVNHLQISNNPTPRNPLLLRMMALDTVTSIYLGRPCYNGFSATPPCHSSLWTNERYSIRVINTMAIALEHLYKWHPAKKIVLIGFSGGGTLAMLMADRVKGLSGIVTIAGNLDIDAWSHLHGYTPLTGSINPAQQLSLSPKLYQLHLVGGKDENIPLRLIQPTVLHQPSAKLMVIPEFDHSCCWQSIWPSVLKTIQTGIHSNKK